MCGISGAFAKHITDEMYTIVADMVESQFSRGPDYQTKQLIEGQYSHVVFGHNRLSIIDLSEQAHQPMFDATKRYCIVYNGEIYNYIELRAELEKAGLKFNTRSDTEVILNAFAHWGIKALSYFNGPYAFALFDTKTDEVWLCRDRFGIRPLYYIIRDNVLYFASTTNVLASALKLAPNLVYAARGLKYFVYEDDTDLSPFIGLASVPSSSYMHVSINSHGKLAQHINKYYDLSEQVQHLMANISLDKTDDLLDLMETKLNTAINLRLRADVPVAISISGGLDSSSIAALVRKQQNNIIGFSFGHPLNKKTEGPLVAECAKWMDLKINYVWPTQKEMVEGLFEVIGKQNAPFSSLSIVAQYLLYKQVKQNGIKVLLGGQGGDESFMGYRKFLLFYLQQLIRQKRYIASAKNLFHLLPMLMSEVNQFKLYWSHRNRYRQNKGLVSSLNLPASPELRLTHTQQQPLWQRQMQDITQFSLPSLLRYEDRNAMANSVESRLPFMDYQLVELGLALPEAIKLRAGYGKWPLREIMRHKVPDSIRLARYKRGFDIPMGSLLNAGLGHSIRQRLESQHLAIKDFLTHPIKQAFSDQQFMTRRNTIAEAVTLLWLINQGI